jgi:hypothetical protein
MLLIAHAIEVTQALGRSAMLTAMNTAVLHDVVEGSDWTTNDLRNRGVDLVICEALDILTPSSGETYMAYIERICASTGLAGETARLVKEADLKVNLARADSDTLRERYARSLPLVQNALAIAS